MRVAGCTVLPHASHRRSMADAPQLIREFPYIESFPKKIMTLFVAAARIERAAWCVGRADQDLGIAIACKCATIVRACRDMFGKSSPPAAAPLTSGTAQDRFSRTRT